MHAPHALALLTVSLSLCVACGPASPADSATDSDATDSASGDTTGDTTGGATEGATEGVTSGDTTGDAEMCPAVDPAVKSDMAMDLGAWPLTPDAYPDQIKIAADCVVKTANVAGGAISLDLLCTEGEQVDMPIRVSVDGPADFAIEIAVDAAVKLEAFWEGDAVDYVGGQWFVLRDGGGALLLAALNYHAGASPSDRLAPISLATIGGVCEPTCEFGCTTPEWDMVERRGVEVIHADGPIVAVLDGQRGQLTAGGDVFDMVVGEARSFTCLNCDNNYRWALRRVSAP